MRLLVVGHGRTGRLVAALAGEYGCEVAGIIDSRSAARLDGAASGVDVAIDFSTPDAVAANVPALARLGVNMVIGTTGWQTHESAIRRAVAEANVGAVVAPNFSAGVVIFGELVRRAAELFRSQTDFGAWLHEAHHAGKKDAPSGTALMLVRDMERAGYGRRIDVSSTRAGHVPGAHEIGFDGPAETVTLSHVARDRTAFARGALLAAQWIKGRRGWYSMSDVLGLT